MTRPGLPASLTVSLIAVAAAWLVVAEGRGQSTETCVDVRIGEQRSYDCLNNAFAQLAREAHAPVATGMLSAASPPSALGTFNHTATAERMGDAFGHSVVAQRPPPPVYVSPLFARPSR